VLKEKNEALIKTLNPKTDSSKILKARSNILIVVLRLETIENYVSGIQQELQTKGCHSCR